MTALTARAAAQRADCSRPTTPLSTCSYPGRRASGCFALASLRFLLTASSTLRLFLAQAKQVPPALDIDASRGHGWRCPARIAQVARGQHLGLGAGAQHVALTRADAPDAAVRR